MASEIKIEDIKEHAEVVGSDHEHVGKVDHAIDDKNIKLAKNDSDADNSHHAIPLEWVASIDGDKVVLNKTADDVHRTWQAI